MRVRDLPEFQSAYLWAEDLKGKDVTLTIADVKIEKLRNPSGEVVKTVFYFEEMKDRKGDEAKRFAPCKTDLQTMRKMFGDNVPDWKGQKITLFPTTTKLVNDTVPCIRIRKKAKVKPV